MEAVKTNVKDLLLVKADVHVDNRGYFFESWNREDFKKAGITADFIQDNISVSSGKWTLRGLHYQAGEFSQAKLVRCLKGELIDVAVDLRRESETFGKWASVVLKEGDGQAFFVPRGFAHGFLTLSDEVIFSYKVDNTYNRASERNIFYGDPGIGIEWGLPEGVKPLLKPADEQAPMLKDVKDLF
ncbi:MAG: dTDP-4-dehydrorhamnose 3,5-epimerase [Lachnospiraceae bacterium]|nr:dTDP-4-dehydrorhamnose 3,5-epimerase [Lachnospiraceae bacterium]